MKQFSTFLIGLTVTFGLPWYVLVLNPYIELSKLEPVPYDVETDEQEGFFPPGRPGIVARGREVFRREGCVNCHTQMVRPTYAGMDSFKRSYGRDMEVLKPVHVRETLPHDFLGQDYALLGQVRNGPDLANVGYRRTDAGWHHNHLYNPRFTDTWSTMPSFRHLYERRLIQGAPAGDAVVLTEEDRLKDGYEVVPTYDARALVGYLMSLKNDQKVPASLVGGNVAKRKNPGKG